MSEKLKPCPFCSKEAELDTLKIIAPSGIHKSIRIVKCQCGGLMLGFSESEAITAWNNRTLSKTETVEPVKDSYKLNEPLTLEELKQLKQMDKSEWVWLWFPELPKDESGWFRANMTYGVYSHERYGKTWLAYRHKKEEGE